MDPEADIRAWLYRYINEACLYRVGPGEELLPARKADQKYSWQFYLRRGLTNAEFLRKVGELFWAHFAPVYDKQPFQVTGLETGATPLVIGIAMTAPFPVNCFVTRAERKTYGLKNRFEGIIIGDLPVMIVDDLKSSKSTMHRCKTYLEEAGLDVFDTAFAIIDKDVGAHDYGLLVPEIVTLFKASDFPLKYGAYLEKMGVPPQRWTEGRTKKEPGMLDYVFGHDDLIGDFVANLIPHCRRGFGPNIRAMGVIDRVGDLIAGVVWHNWDPDAGVIELSGAAVPGKHWLSRRTLRHMYAYPFEACDCQMVVQRTPADAEMLLGLLATYGFDFVTVRRLFGRDRDGVICTLTKEAWQANKFNRPRHSLEEAA
jgi:orotate phosphoribosyltransferase